MWVVIFGNYISLPQIVYLFNNRKRLIKEHNNNPNSTYWMPSIIGSSCGIYLASLMKILDEYSSGYFGFGAMLWFTLWSLITLFLHKKDFEEIVKKENIPDLANLYKGLKINRGKVTYYLFVILFSSVNILSAIKIASNFVSIDV